MNLNERVSCSGRLLPHNSENPSKIVLSNERLALDDDITSSLHRIHRNSKTSRSLVNLEIVERERDRGSSTLHFLPSLFKNPCVQAIIIGVKRGQYRNKRPLLPLPTLGFQTHISVRIHGSHILTCSPILCLHHSLPHTFSSLSVHLLSYSEIATRHPALRCSRSFWYTVQILVSKSSLIWQLSIIMLSAAPSIVFRVYQFGRGCEQWKNGSQKSWYMVERILLIKTMRVFFYFCRLFSVHFHSVTSGRLTVEVGLILSRQCFFFPTRNNNWNMTWLLLYFVLIYY